MVPALNRNQLRYLMIFQLKNLRVSVSRVKGSAKSARVLQD